MKTAEMVRNEIAQILKTELFASVLSHFMERIGPGFGIRIEWIGTLVLYKKISPLFTYELLSLATDGGNLVVVHKWWTVLASPDTLRLELSKFLKSRKFKAELKYMLAATDWVCYIRDDHGDTEPFSIHDSEQEKFFQTKFGEDVTLRVKKADSYTRMSVGSFHSHGLNGTMRSIREIPSEGAGCEIVVTRTADDRIESFPLSA